MVNNHTKTSMDDDTLLSIIIINKGKYQLLNDGKDNIQKEGKSNAVMFKCMFFLFHLILINYFL